MRPGRPEPDPAAWSKCWLVIKPTTNGWEYDKKVTNPNQGVYKCDPKNATKTQSYQ